MTLNVQAVRNGGGLEAISEKPSVMEEVGFGIGNSDTGGNKGFRPTISSEYTSFSVLNSKQTIDEGKQMSFKIKGNKKN